jgi:DNA polymerase family B
MCGGELFHKNKNAKYCSDVCRKNFYERTKHLVRPFVAIDGEGLHKSGDSRYVLLAAQNSEPLFKREGLGTKECLDYLLSLNQGRRNGVRPIFVWFAFDYDVNMILGDLPLKGERGSIQQLRAENHTWWNDYKITYIPRKILKVKHEDRRFHSTDIFTFYQCSFEKALQDWDIEVPEIITRGKAARQNFWNWSEEDITAYNDAELQLMSILAERLREAVRPLSLPIRSWHGPGALAGSWLSKHKAKRYKGELPEEVHNAATRAYFGGRIDVQGYGIIEPVYHYDIVSAYPSAIRYLPDLSNLAWKNAEGERPPTSAGVYVSRVRWKTQETKWSPFPWRSHNGSIRYPSAGEGWYWQSEIEACLDRFGPDSLEFLETWYTDGDIRYPFKDAVEEAFEYRKELKAKGLSSHIAVKLILNSLYGKFAQTVGRAQYYSPVWAGLITSHTRAELMRQLSDSVVCVMTDSIWTKSPLSVDTSATLGTWEEQAEGTLILAGAGLYEAHKQDGTKIVWQRGFDKRKPLDIQGIVTKWLGSDPLYEGRYSINRFVGMGLASVTSNPWREWVDLDRRVLPLPFVGTTKREPLYPLAPGEEKAKKFQPLNLRPADEEACSYPYRKLTIDPENLVSKLEEEIAA